MYLLDIMQICIDILYFNRDFRNCIEPSMRKLYYDCIIFIWEMVVGIYGPARLIE